MHTFEELSGRFAHYFQQEHFPPQPASLYEPNKYFLSLSAKRVRPVLCLMGNELFDTISKEAWDVATAIELFHNFTLIHDDIMDAAPLRRNQPTVHEKYGASTALLAGDVMLIAAYENLNKIPGKHLGAILKLFNQTAKEVCEGQQLDMDFEKKDGVGFDDYIQMINLKTSVLLGASLKMGAILGGTGDRNQNFIYEFGRKLGLAFQVQDDYLDAFGDPQKFGKQVGGDIKANKKTFLLIHALQAASDDQKHTLKDLLQSNNDDKVEKVLAIYKDCKVDEWAQQLKDKYLDEAFNHLEDIAVLQSRKEQLKKLALFLVQRDY